jgi:hypothetical protein
MSLEATADQIDLNAVLLPLRRWWLPIAAGTVIAILVTAMVSKFVLIKWYRATAILKPVTATTAQSRLVGLLGGEISGGGVEAGLLETGSVSAGQEYLTILKSFAFSTSMVERHHLREEILEHDLAGMSNAGSDPQWQIYRILNKRFSGDYSLKAGQLNLNYESPDRRWAERILGYYVDDLRDRLRTREVQSATAAAISFQEQIGITADTLLQRQLYELIAKQIEREKLAQVEADFAFTVLEPPTASDRPYRPQVLINSMAAGFVALTLLAASAVVFGSRKGSKRPSRAKWAVSAHH